jgi:hypothetical protein
MKRKVSVVSSSSQKLGDGRQAKQTALDDSDTKMGAKASNQKPAPETTIKL